MEKKIIKAQDILKEKNFSFPPFNTEAFTDAVVQFFRENEVSAKLTLIPLRFAEMEDTPTDGFAVPFKGVDEDGDNVYIFPSFFPWRYSIHFSYNYLFVPFIFINDVYMENAVALLKMLGFVVGRLKTWKSYGFKYRDIALV